MRAESQIVKMDPIAATRIDPTISTGETLVSPMRIGMMIGEDHGSHDSATASFPDGASMTGLTQSHALMMRTITGAAACWASCSLFTIDPAAAYSVA